MGILDNIIGRSPFLRNTQSAFGQQPAPQQPIQSTFQMPQPVPQQAPQQQQQQSGGIDPSMIMKIISMFGGM